MWENKYIHNLFYICIGAPTQKFKSWSKSILSSTISGLCALTKQLKISQAYSKKETNRQNLLIAEPDHPGHEHQYGSYDH